MVPMTADYIPRAHRQPIGSASDYIQRSDGITEGMECPPLCCPTSRSPRSVTSTHGLASVLFLSSHSLGMGVRWVWL